MKLTDDENNVVPSTIRLKGIKTYLVSYPSPDFVYFYGTNKPAWYVKMLKELLKKQDAVLEKK